LLRTEIVQITEVNKKAKGPISRSGRLCRFGADAVLPVGIEKPDDSSDKDKFDGEVEAVEDGFEAGVRVIFAKASCATATTSMSSLEACNRALPTP
jgi:hypothetical protein